ncbi:MAG TPA: hypothetical protein VNG53_03055 [Bacteroidia bacterium]|nr:hypothetical protein [Bacteroidia bacterium]
MKKLFLISTIILVCITNGYSQTTTSKTNDLAPKEKMLCKAWKMVSAEQFGVVAKPTEAEKNDGITFTDDKKLSITREGKTEQGTWKTNKIQSYIYISIDNSKENFYLKLISVTDKQLVYIYQDADLISTTYTFQVSDK